LINAIPVAGPLWAFVANWFLKGIPVEVLKRYEKWKDIARLSGPQGLRAIKGYHDEALSGEWKGHRSSRLGLQWRVIYRVVADILEVHVVHVTAHDDRRP
jgi:addiction module RelE/StbE family toxin